MATPGQVGEAFRSVLLANNYRQSQEHEAFDTGKAHRQFYLTGPRLGETAHPGSHWHDTVWEVTAWVGYEPRPASSDPDRGRFEIADWLDELLEAWGSDATIKLDEFSISTADPIWAEDDEFWAVEIAAQFRNRRSY